MPILAAASLLLVCQFNQSTPMLQDHPPFGLESKTNGGVALIAMPLQHTGVQAKISGFGAEVTVDQTFSNPNNVPVEATYTFPLPSDAAVNHMQIRVGNRVIEGNIKPRDEARAIYEEAKAAGQSAALLDQERPNIFTQTVANLMPGSDVHVEIRYVQVLKYEEGSFEFNFPMVVGPRYTNATTTDTHKIVPPYTPEGTHTGHLIDLNVSLDAGAPIREIHSVLHKADIQLLDPAHAKISLDPGDRIPNKDFLLRYQLATGSVQRALLSHFDPQKGGYFALMLMPPKAPKPDQIVPREFIFVMDQSGSQNGGPIAVSKELTFKLMKTMRPGDTFNVIGFNNAVVPLWKSPHAYNEETLRQAEAFLNPMEGNGGTEIAAGVLAALDPPADPKRLRIVVFNTDGYVGEEKTILGAIRTHRRNARIFTFGIGNAVNHYLIDAMSEEGKGASETVTLGEPTEEKVARFVRRTQTPILTEVSVGFEGKNVSDTEPQQIPDVFDETPVMVFGRYTKPGITHVTLQGNLGHVVWSQSLDLKLSGESDAPAIESLWARRKVVDLERDDWAESVGEPRLAPKDAVRSVALEYSIMSSQTSFVAVEKRVVNIGGKQVSVRVPIERVEGTGPLAYPGGPGGFGGGGMGGGIVNDGYVSYNSMSKSSGGTMLRVAQSAAPSRRIRIIHGDPTALRANESDSGKIDINLKSAKGSTEIEILVDNISDENLKKLKDLGFVLEDKQPDLKALFGHVDAEQFKLLVELDFVERISKV